MFSLKSHLKPKKERKLYLELSISMNSIKFYDKQKTTKIISFDI